MAVYVTFKCLKVKHVNIDDFVFVLFESWAELSVTNGIEIEGDQVIEDVFGN